MDSRAITLVYMGDSVTVGQHIDPAVRWTSLLDRRLHDHFGQRVATHNRGISGETTRMGLERFPRDVQAFRPQVMTLQFGLNDCNCWQTDEGHPRVSQSAFVANLHEMITRARLFGAQEIILSTNHHTLRQAPMASGESLEEANLRYNNLIRQVAVETHVVLCEIEEGFASVEDTALEDLLLAAPDVLHLSEQGNRVYADIIWPHVHRLVGAALERKGLLIEK
jgi:acyl-CoA thioesterase-1